MYCLMIDSGALPQETAKEDGDQRWARMRVRTQTPVHSRRTAYAVWPLRRCTRTEIA